MTEKRFKNIGNDIWQGNEVWCVAGGEHCADVITTTLNEVLDENEQLKQTMQEVAELLSEEVDLFSNKATEHDICAYVELKELDNKDAYYMAISTKKAIKMLKGDVE